MAKEGKEVELFGGAVEEQQSLRETVPDGIVFVQKMLSDLCMDYSKNREFSLF